MDFRAIFEEGKYFCYLEIIQLMLAPITAL